jgi:uncharacterized membrane protein
MPVFYFSSMSDHLQQELKKEFQLERMILFSDAVFAIAITLLAIEIKVPESVKVGEVVIHIDRHTVTDGLLLHALGEMIPKFVGFFISFFIIGLYWTVHHRMFGFVVNYTRRLLWLNLIFLLAVVLMPFSTAFYSEFVISLLKLPVLIYAGNIVFLGIMNLVLWIYITKPKNNLSHGITTPDKKYFTFRAVTVPSIFILMAVIYVVIDPKYAVWIPMTIPISLRIFRTFYFRKHKIK